MTAFFLDKSKSGFATLEGAMAWADAQAIKRMGVRGHVAEAKGYAQIFNV